MTYSKSARAFINRLITFSFIILVGYFLAKSIYYVNVIGIILALISLIATIYFLYLLAKVQQERKEEEPA